MVCVAIAKCLLVFLNVLISIIAFLFIVIGAALAFARTLIETYAMPMLQQQLASLMGDSGGNSGLQISEEDWNRLVNGINSVAIPLLIVGIIIFVITFCGCCGVCCSSKVMLAVYAIIMTLITVGFIGFGIWIWTTKDELLAEGEPGLQKWVQDNYVNETSTDFPSIVINLLNVMGGCCGMVNYTDFTGYPKQQERTVNTGGGTVTVTFTQITPFSCCNNLTIENPEPDDKNCSTSPSHYNNNFDKGCYRDFLMPMIDEYSDYLLYGLIGIIVFLAIITLFGWLVCCSLTNEKRVSYV